VVAPKYHAVNTDDAPFFKVYNGEQFNGNSYCGQRYGLLDSSGRDRITSCSWNKERSATWTAGAGSSSRRASPAAAASWRDSPA
jgi:hypothetical protein